MSKIYQLYQRSQDFINLILSLVITMFQHFIYPGPPRKSWSIKFHIVFNLIRSWMSFKPGQLLEKIRKKSDEQINLPKEGYKLKEYKVPTKYRLEAFKLIKEKLKSDLSYEHKYQAEELAKELDLELCYKENSFNHEDDKTILYLHGGAYMMCSVNTHRKLTSNIAHNADAKLFSLNYRLAPEHPFPSALEDALATYLFLTAPKSDKVNGLGINPQDIVVAGDSAGGGLAMSFTLLLRDLQDFKVGMISGTMLISPWVDLTSSQPSFIQNSVFDYLPGPDNLHRTTSLDHHATQKPVSKAKPYDFINQMVITGAPQLKSVIEARGHFYAEVSWLNYYLVSPLFADNFMNLPPIFITVGHDERLRDEAVVLAHKINQAQSTKTTIPAVQLYSFDEMPHVFQLFSFDPTPRLALKLSGEFIKTCHSLSSKKDTSDLNNSDVHPLSSQKLSQGKGWAWFVNTNLENSIYPFDIHKEL